MLKIFRGMRMGLLVGAVMAIAAGAGRDAAAQGMFYAEEAKDGRIYVFNIGANYESWKAGGEVGQSAITRIGVGPAGETMVFDSREAVNLYNFKHNLTPEVFPVEKKAPSSKFSWKDGKTTFESESASMNFSNRIQLRYTYEDLDRPRNAAGETTTGTFRIRRAKTAFEGWLYNKDITYKLQLNWPDTANALEDAWINYDLTGGSKLFMIKAGQFKAPFGRQELTSSGSQQFVDRSIVSAEFEKGYDIGAQLSGLLMGDMIDWRIAIQNGNGRNVTANADRKYEYTARLAFQPFGDPKYSESDFESTASTPLLGVAVNYYSNDQLNKANTVLTDAQVQTIGGDLTFKWAGLSVMAEYFRAQRKEEKGANATYTEFDRPGFHTQVGYMIVPKTLELAARYGKIDVNDTKDNDERIETGVVFNWFINKHAHKLQTDFRQIEDKAKKTKDKELRVQLQFIF